MTSDTAPNVEADYEAAIDRLTAEMARMKEQMDERQCRIEQLQAETEAILAEVKVA
jgi:prefoldin subunit 5